MTRSLLNFAPIENAKNDVTVLLCSNMLLQVDMEFGLIIWADKIYSVYQYLAALITPHPPSHVHKLIPKVY